MNNTEKSDKRISAKWKLCIIIICTAFVFLYLTVKLTEHIRKNDPQGQPEGGDTLKLHVQKKGETLVYTSADGAITWFDGRKPDFYMQMPEENLTDSATSIPIEIVNVSDSELTFGSAYLLYVWSDNEWNPTEVNYMSHDDLGYSIRPHASYEVTCGLYNIRLNVGKYLITKTVFREDDRSEWTLSAEFTVE